MFYYKLGATRALSALSQNDINDAINAILSRATHHLYDLVKEMYLGDENENIDSKMIQAYRDDQLHFLMNKAINESIDSFRTA